MKLMAVIAALVLSTGVVRAQDEDPEAGLTAAILSGPDPSIAPSASPIIRSQLVTNHTATWRVIGGVSLGVGIVLEVASWALYGARQAVRMKPRYSVGPDVVDDWEALGAWSLWTGVGASGLIVTGEYLLLPEARGVPWWAWGLGAVGLATAAVGVGFLAGGTHCGPTPVAPGAVFDAACQSGFSDALFGPLLMLASVPLLNLPVAFLLRDAFGEVEPLSFGPGSVRMHGRF